MRKFFFIVLFSTIMPIGLQAQQSGSVQMKEHTNQQVVVAGQWMTQAFQIVQQDLIPSRKEMAIAPLAQAGRTFEQVAQSYQTLAPEHASPSDVENSLIAMQRCVQMIQHLQNS